MTDTTTGIKPCPFCGGPGKSITVMGEWVGQGNGPDWRMNKVARHPKPMA